jgi:hypothetical protein
VAHVNKLPSHSPMVYGSPIWWDWSNRDEADADHHPTASYLVNEQERESADNQQSAAPKSTPHNHCSPVHLTDRIKYHESSNKPSNLQRGKKRERKAVMDLTKIGCAGLFSYQTRAQNLMSPLVDHMAI